MVLGDVLEKAMGELLGSYRKPGEEEPTNPPITSPRKIPRTGTTGWYPQDTVHPQHQGAK